MTALLLPEALLQRLEQLLPPHRLDLPLLFLGEVFLGELAQPFLGDLGLLQGLREILQPLEDVAEDAVELVEVPLVLHEAGAGEIVEILDLLLGEVLVERLEQREVLAQRHRHFRGAQLGEEGEEHQANVAVRSRTSSGRRADLRGSPHWAADGNVRSCRSRRNPVSSRSPAGVSCQTMRAQPFTQSPQRGTSELAPQGMIGTLEVEFFGEPSMGRSE